ncbi:MAG: GxxExxY protein [Spirochaetales bacterium]|nr:GxxExxY protein [Spirochaetales bacterium]
MYVELIKRGLPVERQVPIPVVWDGRMIEDSFRADLIVERSLLLELKSTESSKPVLRGL